jgi:hypothetical protein
VFFPVHVVVNPDGVQVNFEIFTSRLDSLLYFQTVFLTARFSYTFRPNFQTVYRPYDSISASRKLCAAIQTSSAAFGLNLPSLADRDVNGERLSPSTRMSRRLHVIGYVRCQKCRVDTLNQAYDDVDGLQRRK